MFPFGLLVVLIASFGKGSPTDVSPADSNVPTVTKCARSQYLPCQPHYTRRELQGQMYNLGSVPDPSFKQWGAPRWLHQVCSSVPAPAAAAKVCFAPCCLVDKSGREVVAMAGHRQRVSSINLQRGVSCWCVQTSSDVNFIKVASAYFLG